MRPEEKLLKQLPRQQHLHEVQANSPIEARPVSRKASWDRKKLYSYLVGRVWLKTVGMKLTRRGNPNLRVESHAYKQKRSVGDSRGKC